MDISLTPQPQRRVTGEAISGPPEEKSFAPRDSASADTWEALALDVTRTWRTFEARTPFTDAVALGREPTDGEEAAYNEANEASEAALRRALDYRPATMAELVSKAALFDGPFGQGIEKERLAALTADLRHVLSSGSVHSPSKQAWDAAVAEYEAAAQACREVSDALDAASDAIEAEAPTPAELKLRGGGVFHRAKLVMEANELSEERRLELLDIGQRWWPLHKAAWERHDYDGLEQRWNEADARVCRAVETLLSTPAPDVGAIAYKARIVFERALCDLAEMSPDDPSSVGHVMGKSDWSESTIAYLYVDALRLSGSSAPVVQARPFDCEAFLADWEAKPGFEVTEFGAVFKEFEEDAEDDPKHWDRYTSLPRWTRDELIKFARRRAKTPLA